jgi:hypothetical protein
MLGKDEAINPQVEEWQIRYRQQRSRSVVRQQDAQFGRRFISFIVSSPTPCRNAAHTPPNLC